MVEVILKDGRKVLHRRGARHEWAYPGGGTLLVTDGDGVVVAQYSNGEFSEVYMVRRGPLGILGRFIPRFRAAPWRR